MGYGSVQAVELVFLLLMLFVVAFGVLARKLKIPYPIVLVIGGTLLGIIPGIPRIALNPDVVFYVILPPLLYAAAWETSWREFSYNLVSILLLAFGLVSFTVIGVAFGAQWIFPGFEWKIGLVLGAVVAPTDALAATSIAQRIGLPKRITDILEGESLVNDATGLLALEFGISILLKNETPTAGDAVLRLTYLIVAGIAVGLVTGWIVNWIERRIDDGPIEIAISILVRGVLHGGCAACLGSPGSGRLWTLSHPQEFRILFTGRASAGMGILGCIDPYPKWSRVRAYRPATSLCVGWNPRLQFGHAGSVWRPVQWVGHYTSGDLGFSRRVRRAVDPYPHHSPEYPTSNGAWHPGPGLGWYARRDCTRRSHRIAADIGRW